MTDAVRRLRINRRYELSACGWCADALTLGEEGAVCEACESPHHARCWDNENGCGETGCLNAPLRQDPVFRLKPILPHETHCLQCGNVITVGTTVCPDCERVRTLSGFSQGVREMSDEAYQAFLFAIASILVPPLLSSAFADHFQSEFWGIVPLAIGVQGGRTAFTKARLANRQIASDQTLKGTGFATAAQILGLLAIAFAILIVLAILGRHYVQPL